MCTKKELSIGKPKRRNGDCVSKASRPRKESFVSRSEKAVSSSLFLMNAISTKVTITIVAVSHGSFFKRLWASWRSEIAVCCMMTNISERTCAEERYHF